MGTGTHGQAARTVLRRLTPAFSRTGMLLAGLLAAFIVAFALMVAPVRADFGVGWSAQYWANTDFSGAPVFTESLPNGVNLNFGTTSPNPIVPVDNFVARFSSVQQLNAGTYQFTISADDGARVIIDGQTVYDQFRGRPLTTESFQLTFPNSASHAITVEYLETINEAIVQFQWQQIGGTVGTPSFGTPGFGTPGSGAFPTPFGTPPGPTPTAVYTGPLATVTGVRGLGLRTGPYVGASYITTLEGGQSYPVVARNNDEGIYNWYLIRVGERQGWASGRYLTISVDRNLLPLQSSVFDQIDNATDLNVVGATRAVMNMRRRPSPRTAQVGSIPWGDPVSIIGRTVQAGTDRWYQVRYNGVVGWIDARYVTVRGERFAVPIR